MEYGRPQWFGDVRLLARLGPAGAWTLNRNPFSARRRIPGRNLPYRVSWVDRALDDALPELAQRGRRERETEARRLVQRQPAVGDPRRVLEQLGLERVALRVGEGLHDASRRARGDDVRVNEAVVVRRHLDVVHLAQRGELPPLGEAAHHGAVELEDADRLLFEQRAAAEAGELAFAAGERDAGAHREQLELAPVVRPAHRLLQPARPQRLEQSRALDRGLEVPGAVHVHHQVALVADHLAHQRHALDVFLERQPADLALEAGVALRLEHLDLVAQLGHVLALAVIGAGDIAWHLAAVATEQPVERQVGDLAHDVPGCDVNRRRDAHDRLARPTLL